jgi:ribose 5-phosphate isomerase A
MTNVDAALAMISDGMTVGLGSGSASERFLKGLGDRVAAGTLRIRGVPTSVRIAELATTYKIPLVELDAAMPIDVAVDGADEVDPQLNMIKGFGKALVREKIVAAAAKTFVILIGPERVAEKRVAVLGQRGKLPIEVVPFGVPLVLDRLRMMGMPAEVLMENGGPVTSDNGNRIVHAAVSSIPNPADLDRQLQQIPGVVDTGLFVDMADVVLAETDGVVEHLR